MNTNEAMKDEITFRLNMLVNCSLMRLKSSCIAVLLPMKVPLRS